QRFAQRDSTKASRPFLGPVLQAALGNVTGRHVRADAERAFTGTCQYHHPNRRILLDVLPDRLQLRFGCWIDRIQDMWPVNGDAGNVLPDLEQDVAQAVTLSPRPSSRNTSLVCSPSRGGCRRTPGGVSDSFSGLPSV